MGPFVGPFLSLLLIAIVLRQCRRPAGLPGRIFVWLMNRTHSGLADWGLSHVEIGPAFRILDIGCGGGRTVKKLAAAAREGKVFGVDYSKPSVAEARRVNRAAIEAGQVDVRVSEVSKLPYEDASFDLVTAMETHYYWPDLASDFREVLRVLKPGGRFMLVAEVYKGSRFGALQGLAMKPLGGKVLSVEQHRELLAKAGYAEVEVHEQRARGWICAVGRRPA
jgi:SAM-dependent methyltransferase